VVIPASMDGGLPRSRNRLGKNLFQRNWIVKCGSVYIKYYGNQTLIKASRSARAGWLPPPQGVPHPHRQAPRGSEKIP